MGHDNPILRPRLLYFKGDRNDEPLSLIPAVPAGEQRVGEIANNEALAGKLEREGYVQLAEEGQQSGEKDKSVLVPLRQPTHLNLFSSLTNISHLTAINTSSECIT